MNINQDINMLASLRDFGLVSTLMKEDLRSLDMESFPLVQNVIKTSSSFKRLRQGINRTLLGCKNEKVFDLYKSMILNEGITSDSLIFLYWNCSYNNDMLNYLNDRVYFPSFFEGKSILKIDDTISCVNELREVNEEVKAFASSTVERFSSKYLTLLKKFGLLEGGVKKKILNLYLNDKMFVVFIYWLLEVETKSNLLESPWLKYSFLEPKFFAERVMQKKFTAFYNMTFTGDNLKIEPIIEYSKVHNAISTT